MAWYNRVQVKNKESKGSTRETFYKGKENRNINKGSNNQGMMACYHSTPGYSTVSLSRTSKPDKLKPLFFGIFSF